MSDDKTTTQGNDENIVPSKNGTQTQTKNDNPWKKKQGGGNNNNGNNNNPNIVPKKKFQGGTKGLEEDFFYYGTGMDEKYLQSKEKVLSFIAKKFSSSEQVSIETNTVTLLGHKVPTKFKTEEELKKLDYWQQEQWHIDMKRYTDNLHALQKNLTTCYPIIWDQLSTALQNQVKRDAKFKTVELERDAPGLFAIVTSICTKTSNIDHYMTRSVDALYSITQLSGNNLSIGEYHKQFVAKRKAAEQAGVHFSSPEQRIAVKKVALQKNNWTVNSDEYKTWEKEVDHHTEEQFYAIIFLRQAGDRYDEVRRELKNDFAKGTDNIPSTVDEVYSLLQLYQFEPKAKGQTKSKKKGGNGEYDDANPNAKGKYPGHSFQQNFQCGREGHIAPKCTFDTKEDGSPVNENYKRKSTAKVTFADDKKDQPTTSGTTLHARDFDFKDELDRESLMQAYGYVQRAIATTYVEDMRGNNRYSLNMNHVKARLDRFWILLDNQSTVNIFWNTMFLVNIRRTEKRLELHTNAGSTIIDEIGELPGVGTVWVHRNGIANILSFHSIQEINKFEIDYSSRPNKDGIRDKAFRIESPEKKRLRFIPDGRGLYFLDCEKYFGCGLPGTVFGEQITNTEDTLVMPEVKTTGVAPEEHDEIQTIDNNKTKYTQRDVRRAERVRRFQHIASHPSDKTLLAMVTKRTLKNVPIVPRDIRLANKILGKSVYGLKGKRTFRQTDTVEVPEIIPLPRSIEENYKDITLACDILHVNRIPFLATISRAIHYGTIDALPSMTFKNMEAALTQVIKSYNIRGFDVKNIFVDMQFEGLERHLDDRVKLNVVSRQEHVPEMERYIRVIKERARATYAMLPFDRIPKKMMVALLSNVVFYLNAFPWEEGVSAELSPYTIIEGVVLDYNLHFQVIFGEYAQTYEGTDNTLKERTIGAIALGPSGNLQGGVKLFSLDSGEIINRPKDDYELLPMPADVIKRVNRMARKSRNTMTFGDRNNNPFPDSDDDDDDPDYVPPEQSTDIEVDVPDDMDDHEIVESDDSDDDQHAIRTTGVTPPEPPTEDPPDDNDDDEELDDEPQPEVEDIEDDNPQDNDDDEEEEEEEDLPEIRTTSSGRQIRSTQRDDYVYLTKGNQNVLKPLQCNQFLTKTKDIDIDLSQQKIKRILSPNERENFLRTLQFMEAADVRPNLLLHYACAQMNVSKGIKTYGEDGKESAMKEVRNLVMRDCFGEVEYESLTPKQKRLALPILMFMVKKRDGSLKSRGCADGRTQRLWTDKSEVSSPTPAIEAIKYILAISAFERRDVASFNLPAQFLQTEMDQLLHLRITGTVALLLVESDPERWEKHLRKEHGRPVIYVVCKKAIYGTLSAAILAYRKLTGYFEDWGFQMNPYDPCVWNKQVAGKQMTIVFHVDDGLVSHEDPREVTKFLKQLEGVYGKTDPLTIKRGKEHDYLGMTIDFSNDGEVMISMYDYVQKLINKLPKDMIGEKPTAAPEYLFKTNDRDSVKLPKDMADLYHTLTATTLYLSQRARVDLQLAVSFLCTRVKSPDEHDWKKLTHLMKYLQATAYLPLILRCDGKGTCIYIDGSHAVHSDMKGHVGVYATEGAGAMYSSSNKLKLNTVSSTETEIVSVGERLSKVLWYRLFRIAQGGYANEDILMQDNQSAILLENNGRYSAGKGSKHIDIRYFFITDRIEKKHIKVKYCPTEEMLADFFTKPLQGSLFYKFRDAVLGIDANDFSEYKTRYYEILKKFDLLNTIATGDITRANKSQECVEHENIRTKDRQEAGTRVEDSNRKPLQEQSHAKLNSYVNTAIIANSSSKQNP